MLWDLLYKFGQEQLLIFNKAKVKWFCLLFYQSSMCCNNNRNDCCSMFFACLTGHRAAVWNWRPEDWNREQSRGETLLQLQDSLLTLVYQPALHPGQGPCLPQWMGSPARANKRSRPGIRATIALQRSRTRLCWHACKDARAVGEENNYKGHRSLCYSADGFLALVHSTLKELNNIKLLKLFILWEFNNINFLNLNAGRWIGVNPAGISFWVLWIWILDV